MMNLMLEAAAGGEAAAGSGWSAFMPMILIIGIFYFMMIRPQRKRDKELQKMRSEIEVGDEIVTSGGIIGRVVSTRDDTLVIETGSDRSKIRIAKWAIQSNNTAQEEAQKRAAAAREEMERQKQEKKEAKKKEKDDR